MNTRLQVEHPVTELVTGIDLVEQMIRVAAGEKLAFRQSDIKLQGWAVESRIYAEDPSRNFLPSIGRLQTYRPPKEGTRDGITIRNDTGVVEGGEISIHYDPMIAKLVTHAPTRGAAIEHMAGALDTFIIEGIRHNIGFLATVMQNERWRAGKLSTGFIAEEFPDGFKAKNPQPGELDTLAAVAVAIDHVNNMRRRHITQQMNGTFRFAKRRVVRLGTEQRVLEVAGGDEAPVSVRPILGDRCVGDPVEVSSNWWPGDPVWMGRVGDTPISVKVRVLLNGHQLSWRGIEVRAYVYTEREAALAALMPETAGADTLKVLLCPMPGLVKAVHVSQGQEVKAGDAIAVVEAMKMENILRAERDSVVKSIKVKPGDSLAVDAVILEFA